jgi:glycosyltransferase involved in cell wall biosynthesis
MRILYFGAYDPEYDRNNILRNGLKANGVDVVECSVPPTTRIWKRNLLLGWKFLKLGNKRFDAIILAEVNQETAYLGKLISKLYRAPLIVDIFVSKYDTFICDRKTVGKNSMKAKLFYLADKYCLKLADIVLSDTSNHSDFYSRCFGTPLEKIKTVYIGARPEYQPAEEDKRANDKVRLLFWGTYIPLHGIEHIVETAKLLEKDTRFEFTFVGRGQTYRKIIDRIDKYGLNNIVLCDMMALEELIYAIDSSDICLGIFGTTDKAGRVVPNKIFQALAMKKPVITADTPAIRELFQDGEHMLLCRPGNPKDLADKIVLLAEDNALVEKISSCGHVYYNKCFTTGKVGARLEEIIKDMKSGIT